MSGDTAALTSPDMIRANKPTLNTELSDLLSRRGKLLDKHKLSKTERESVATNAASAASADERCRELLTFEQETVHKSDLFNVFMELYLNYKEGVPVQPESMHRLLAQNHIIRRGWTTDQNMKNVERSINKVFANAVESGKNKISDIKKTLTSMFETTVPFQELIEEVEIIHAKYFESALDLFIKNKEIEDQERERKRAAKKVRQAARRKK